MSEPFIGEIRLISFNFAPRNWAFCDGQTLPIRQNEALFSLLGTTYGGNGSNSFSLPDLRGRAPIHSGQGPGLSPRVIGENVGLEAVGLVLSTMPAHNHAIVTSAPQAEVAVTNEFVNVGSSSSTTTVNSDFVTVAAPNASVTVDSDLVTVSAPTATVDVQDDFVKVQLGAQTGEATHGKPQPTRTLARAQSNDVPFYTNDNVTPDTTLGDITTTIKDSSLTVTNDAPGVSVKTSGVKVTNDAPAVTINSSALTVTVDPPSVTVDPSFIGVSVGKPGAASTDTGGSQPHQNMQPSLVLNYIIALEGIYPPRS